jgi:hypothetical protein
MQVLPLFYDAFNLFYLRSDVSTLSLLVLTGAVTGSQYLWMTLLYH